MAMALSWVGAVTGSVTDRGVKESVTHLGPCAAKQGPNGAAEQAMAGRGA